MTYLDALRIVHDLADNAICDVEDAEDAAAFERLRAAIDMIGKRIVELDRNICLGKVA